MWLNNQWHLRQIYEDQYKSQTENILPVSLTVSLSIQLMTTFKPSSGIQSNLVVGVGAGIYFNFPPRNYWGPLNDVACTVSAMSAICAALPAQRRACNAQCACMHAAYQSMHIHFELVCVKSMEIDLHWFNTHELKMDMFWILSSCVLNQWRSISIDLTRTSSKWICFGYVWNRDVTILQFGYAAFMVEIFYVRWSILDQSLHWDIFMRDIMHFIKSDNQFPSISQHN